MLRPSTESWLLEDDRDNDDPQWYDIPISNHMRVTTMSLAIVLVGKDGLVMASDNREIVQVEVSIIIGTMFKN